MLSQWIIVVMPTEGSSYLKEEPKEEPLDDYPSMPLNNENSNQPPLFLKEPKEEPLEIELKEEPLDIPLSDGNQKFCLDVIDEFQDEPILNEDMDSSENSELDKRKRSSRNAPSPAKCNDYVKVSDGEGGHFVKKSRTESIGKKKRIVPLMRKTSTKGESQIVIMNYKGEEDSNQGKNELDCPECKYSSTSANAWIHHLKSKHSTTPKLAGCLLRCDCGNESFSYTHSKECEISNFTIVRKGDGSIRRSRMTPRCVLCEMHPKSPYGYSAHLYFHHKTTLRANGIYLLCSCGFRFNTHNHHQKHDKKCSGHEFSLHQLNQE